MQSVAQHVPVVGFEHRRFDIKFEKSFLDMATNAILKRLVSPEKLMNRILMAMDELQGTSLVHTHQGRVRS